MAALPLDLERFGQKISSQNDEDGIIDAFFRFVPPRSKSFVEFGIGPNWLDPAYVHGLEGNCCQLRENGWSGLFMDGGDHPIRFNVKKEYITPFNVNSLFEKYDIPRDVDVVSIDVDGHDIWIWLALIYQPQLLIIEYNSNFKYGVSCAIPYDKRYNWDGTRYYGASFSAMEKVGESKGYHPVYCNGVNIFFALKASLENWRQFEPSKVFRQQDIHQADPAARPFVEI